MILFVICVIQPFVSSDKSFNIKPLIIGGRQAASGEFPYQVSLQTKFFRRHFCAASIISNRFLLTAAHCIGGREPCDFIAVVGAVRRDFDGIVYRIRQIVRHEQFNSTIISNDIALLFTTDDIVFTSKIQPISLPKHNDDGNTAVILSGWGKSKVSV